MSDDQPSIEEIEAAIPDDRKHMSFGGPDEDILDVMDRMDKRAEELRDGESRDGNDGVRPVPPHVDQPSEGDDR